METGFTNMLIVTCDLLTGLTRHNKISALCPKMWKNIAIQLMGDCLTDWNCNQISKFD